MYVCVGMCVSTTFISFRSLKIGCDKKAFLNSSMSSRTMFQTVLEEMTKCVPEKKGKETRYSGPSDKRPSSD